GEGGGPGGGNEEHGGEDKEVPPGEAGVLVQQDTDGEGGQRTGGAGREGGVAAAEPGGDPKGEGLLHDRGAGTRACCVETRLDTGCGCDTMTKPERPHDWGRGRHECLRHGPLTFIFFLLG